MRNFYTLTISVFFIFTAFLETPLLACKFCNGKISACRSLGAGGDSSPSSSSSTSSSSDSDGDGESEDGSIDALCLVSRDLCSSKPGFKDAWQALVARYGKTATDTTPCTPDKNRKRSRVCWTRESPNGSLHHSVTDDSGRKVPAITLTPGSRKKTNFIYVISTHPRKFTSMDLNDKKKKNLKKIVDQFYAEPDLRALVDNDELRYFGLSGQDEEDEKSVQDSDKRSRQHAAGVIATGWRRLYRTVGEYLEANGIAFTMQRLVENVTDDQLRDLEALFIEKFRGASGKGLNSTTSEDAFVECTGSKKVRLRLSSGAIKRIKETEAKVKAEEDGDDGDDGVSGSVSPPPPVIRLPAAALRSSLSILLKKPE